MDSHKNMKLRIFITTGLAVSIFLFLIVSEASASQPWTQTYGGQQDDLFNKVIQTADGGFVAVGYTNSFDYNNTSKVWLVKTDANGNPLWNKTYGGQKEDVGYGVVQMSDGGYAIAGYTMSYGNGSMNLYLIRTDDDGNMLWNKTFGGRLQDGAFSIEKTSEDGLIMTGFSYSYGNGGWDVYLVKTDGQGNLLWNKTYGGPDKDAAHWVEQTSDGGYIITGYTKSFGVDGGDIYGVGAENLWLVKTDANGTEQWNKTFGGHDYDDGFFVHQLSDGGYIIAGTTKSFYSNGSIKPAYDRNDTARSYLVRTDSSGNEIWNKTYGGNTDVATFSMVVMRDGYVLAGPVYKTDGYQDIYVLKTDLNGTYVWAYEYGGSKNTVGYSICPVSEGGYVIAGYTDSYGNAGADGYLQKINEDGSGPVTGYQLSTGVTIFLVLIAIACMAIGIFVIWKWLLKK